MRTRVRLDEKLLSESRRCASASAKTPTAMLDETLPEEPARHAGNPRRGPVRLRTCDGTGALPGVELDGSASLFGRMESRGVHDTLG
jgi:hypothetical protein